MASKRIATEHSQNNESTFDLKGILKEILPEILDELMNKKEKMEKLDNTNGPIQILTKLKHLIGTFDGNTSGKDFLNTLEAQCITLEIPEEQRTQNACACLTGGAAKWLLNCPEMRSFSWIEFKKAFIAQFCPQMITRTPLRQFLDLKQGKCMRTHIGKCRELEREIAGTIPEQDLIAIFLRSLNRHEQIILAATEFNSLKEAFNRAIRLADYLMEEGENLIEVRESNRPYFPRPSYQSERTTKYQQHREEVNRSQFDEEKVKDKNFRRNGTRTTERCFNCGEIGHRASFCVHRRQIRDNWNTQRPRNYRMEGDLTEKEEEIENFQGEPRR